MLTLLAVLCPPLAVLAVRKPSQGILNLGLTLMLYFPGLLHALVVVGQHRTEVRNETLMRVASM